MRSPFYSITCKNTKECGKPIVLPLPIRREKSPNLLLWPKDEKPRNFLCRHCNHVYEYTFEDVQEGLDDKHAQLEGYADDTVFRIEARCGGEKCGAPIYILLTGPSSQTTVHARHDWLEREKHGTFRCSSGHMTGLIQPGSVDIHKDTDWVMS